MDPAQIEQMRALAAGGASAPPSERPDDPSVLTKLAARLCADDAVLVVSELVARAGQTAGAHLLRTAAKVPPPPAVSQRRHPIPASPCGILSRSPIPC
eukprot:scaffold32975_cov51-Isochrysis_galbana.AAC.1